MQIRSVQSRICLLATSVVLTSGIFETACSAKLPERTEELRLHADLIRHDFETLDSWIAQLNKVATESNDTQDREVRLAKAKLATRFVYGIETQIDRLTLEELNNNEKARLKLALTKLNGYALAFYQEDALRRTKQKAEDFAHGERQLEAMLQDRPAMAKWVEKGDSIWVWTASQFAGDAIGTRIQWDNTHPLRSTADHHLDYRREYPADCYIPYHEPSAHIRVAATNRKGNERSGDKLWSECVFELQNIRNSAKFHATYDGALAGKVSKTEYMISLARLEFDAVNHTALFYRTKWMPHCKERHMLPRAKYWFIDAPNNFEAWIAQYKDKSSYPFFYAKEYDDGIVPTRKRSLYFKQELGQFKKMGEQYTRRAAEKRDADSSDPVQ